MLKIEVITHGWEVEKKYLKDNIDRIENRRASFKPKYKFLLYVMMESGSIREYHGHLAVRVFKYLTRKGDNI